MEESKGVNSYDAFDSDAVRVPVQVAPQVNPVVQEVIQEVDRAANAQYVQVTMSKVTPRIGAKARNVIYNIGIVLGAVGTIAPVVASMLTGEAEIAVASAGALALALTNWMAKMNLSKTADDIVKQHNK